MNRRIKIRGHLSDFHNEVVDGEKICYLIIDGEDEDMCCALKAITVFDVDNDVVTKDTEKYVRLLVWGDQPKREVVTTRTVDGIVAETK